MKKESTSPIRTFQLPLFHDKRGSLCVSEFKDLPFSPKRAYFLYDTKELRGGHAHKKEQEVFICIAGSFTARVHDGNKWTTITMNNRGKALYTDAFIWHEFTDFSKDAIMLSLSSISYDKQKGYITKFDEFKKSII